MKQTAGNQYCWHSRSCNLVIYIWPLKNFFVKELCCKKMLHLNKLGEQEQKWRKLFETDIHRHKMVRRRVSHSNYRVANLPKCLQPEICFKIFSANFIWKSFKTVILFNIFGGHYSRKRRKSWQICKYRKKGQKRVWKLKLIETILKT